MENITVFSNEKAEGDLSADGWALAVIKVSCILIVGVVILTNVVLATNVTDSSPFFGLMNQVTNNINSGYQLAALMVLVISAGSIMHFLVFM